MHLTVPGNKIPGWGTLMDRAKFKRVRECSSRPKIVKSLDYGQRNQSEGRTTPSPRNDTSLSRIAAC